MQTITLANLGKKSAQEVFEYIATHLLTQRKKCGVTRNGNFSCQYKYKNLRCAAGALFGPYEYKHAYEGVTWSGLRRNGIVTSAHFNLICALQDVHDDYEPDEWGRKLREIGDIRQLSIGFISALEK